MTDHRAVKLFAWIGEDELGSGEIGLKQAIAPAGVVPMVATRFSKIVSRGILDQLQRQANHYGKTIRLVRYVYAEDIATITPEPKR